MRKIHVEISAIKDQSAYQWYKVRKRVVELPLRGKVIDLNPGDVIGLRPSTNGKSTRMVFRDKINVVYSPDENQVKKILLRSEPLIGGSVDNSKIGHLTEPKVGIKDRRVQEELTNIEQILSRGRGITDLKVRGTYLTFKYEGRPYVLKA